MTVATLTLKVSGLPAGRRFNQSSMLSKVITSTSSWCNRLSGRKHFCKLKTWGLGLLPPVWSRLCRSESQEEGENAVGWEENWEGDWSGDWSTIPFLKCRRHQGKWSLFERLPNGEWLSQSGFSLSLPAGVGSERTSSQGGRRSRQVHERPGEEVRLWLRSFLLARSSSLSQAHTPASRSQVDPPSPRLGQIQSHRPAWQRGNRGLQVPCALLGLSEPLTVLWWDSPASGRWLQNHWRWPTWFSLSLVWCGQAHRGLGMDW